MATDPLIMVEAMLRQARIARLATITPSGRATVAPFWFAFEGGRVFIDTVENATVANVRRDPRVSLLVDFGTAYADLRGAIIHGRATVYRPGEAPDWVRRGISTYEAKYADWADERMGTGDVQRTQRATQAFLVITPERVRWFTVGGFFQGLVEWPTEPVPDQSGGSSGT